MALHTFKENSLTFTQAVDYLIHRTAGLQVFAQAAGAEKTQKALRQQIKSLFLSPQCILVERGPSKATLLSKLKQSWIINEPFVFHQVCLWVLMDSKGHSPPHHFKFSWKYNKFTWQRTVCVARHEAANLFGTSWTFSLQRSLHWRKKYLCVLLKQTFKEKYSDLHEKRFFSFFTFFYRRSLRREFCGSERIMMAKKFANYWKSQGAVRDVGRFLDSRLPKQLTVMRGYWLKHKSVRLGAESWFS